MATGQLLSLIISATDKASQVVDKISGKIGGLGKSAQESSAKAGDLSNAIAFGMMKAQAAIGLVQTGYGKLQGMIAESANLQLENMSAAQTFAAVTGKTFDEGAGFIDRLNESLSKSAATLPGATKDYAALARTIQDNLIDAFKDADGKLTNMEGFEKTLTSIAESYGVLSAASNVPVQNTALGLTKALSGGSVAELRQIQAFEQNPAILNAIEQRLQEVGAKSLKDLDAKSRVALLKTIGERFVDDSYKKRAAETFDGLMQGFISGFFDPQTGIFGLSRDLEPNKKGVQSAFKSINGLMNSLIGEGGLYSEVAGLLQDLGLAIDPMKLLRDGVELINHYVGQLTAGISGIRNLLSKGGDLANILQSNLSGLDAGRVGAMVADMVNQLFTRLTSMLAGINYGQVAGFLWTGTLKLFEGVGGFLANLDWRVHAAIAGGILAASAIGAIGTLAAGILATFAAGTAGLPVVLTVAVGLAIGALTKAIVENWDALVSNVSSFFKPIADIIINSANLWLGIVTLDLDRIRSSLQGLFGAISQHINNIRDTIAIITGGKTSGEMRGDAVEQESIDRLAAARRKYGAKWQGHIPNAADGFLGALSSEILNMPRGASPVIANTSETILTPSMLRNLVTGSVGLGASNAGGGTFAPQITVQGASDPETTAKEVLRYLQIFFDEFQAGQLA